MKQMRHLYLAGPYTRPDPITNTHAACRVATALYERGLFVPHVPHLSQLWHMVTPKNIDFWYALDLKYMDRLDAIVRLPGESSGADNELLYADAIGLARVDFLDLPSDVQDMWLERNG